MMHSASVSPLQVTWVRAAVSQMSSSVGTGSVSLAPGNATVRMSVVMPVMSAAAPLLPLRPCLVSVLMARSLARRLSPHAVYPPLCAATELETVTMARMSWAVLTPPVGNVSGTSTAPSLPLTFSVLTGAPWWSLGVPGCWILRTPNPSCCSWTCSWGPKTRCTCTTVCCSGRSTSYRFYHIITTGAPLCWSPVGDR